MRCGGRSDPSLAWRQPSGGRSIRDQRRSNNGPDRSAGIDDAHGRGPLFGRKPFGHGAGGGRKSAPFANAKQQPARGEHGKTRGKSVQSASERPENHDDEKPPARTEAVDQPAAAEIHEAVCNQKSRIQRGLHLISDGDVSLDRFDSPGQRLAIEITDRDGRADQECDCPG